MQILFRGTPKAGVLDKPPADLMEKVRGDWSKSLDYFNQGVFRQLWTSGNGIFFVCEAASLDHLRTLISELPMAKAGLIDIELSELSPYRGFSPTAMQIRD